MVGLEKILTVSAGLALLGWSLAPAAGATIVPQQSIAGIKLGMQKSAVRAKLGKPDAAINGKNDFGPFTRYSYKGQVSIIFQGGPTVTSLRTSSRRQRTSEDVGVGSSEADVKDAYPRAKCRTIVRNRTCYIGSLTPGKRVTDFQIRNGTVRWISIGFVID